MAKRNKRIAYIPLTTLLAISISGSSQAAVNSNRVDVTLTANIVQTLTVTVANPAVAFGAVTPGTTNAAPLGQNLSIISAWNLSSGQTVKLYAYFDNATTALTGTLFGQLIPTSAMSGSFNGGTAQTFTSASPFTSGSTAMTLYSVPVTTSNSIASRTDSLALTMDLTSQTSLKADVYTGTMHLQAQAL